MKFRKDINGMRAIAVLAVVLFHFGVKVLSGGFVGVDIFFVISGFLMTGIIVGQRERGTFSLFGFYLDRARRIIPPLAVLVAILLAGGTAWLMPQDLLILGKHAASAVTFTSNMLFWQEAGYFDAQSSTKWLLHTWSLSVEWQFYMLYPLLVMAVLRIGTRRVLTPIVVLCLIASLLLSIWLSAVKPSAAFYLLPTRAWEMLAGGLVFLLPPLPDRLSRVGQIAGLALIAVAIIISRSLGWPGFGAIIPVLGAALVIAAGRGSSRITGNPVTTWIGLNSYSIYLWHWPVVVMLVRYGLITDWRYQTGGILLALLLGHASYRFVERAGRRGGAQPHIHAVPPLHNFRRHLALAAPVALLVVCGAGIWHARGLPKRFSAEIQALDIDAQPGGPYTHGCFSVVQDVPKPCLVGPGHPDHAALTLIGDSHAEAAAGGVAAALPKDQPGAGLAFNGYAACLPLIGGGSIDPESKCATFNARFLEPLTKPRTTPLLLIGHWQGAIDSASVSFDPSHRPASTEELRQHLIATSCALAKGGPTWLLMPTPVFPYKVTATLQSDLVHNPDAPDLSIALSTYMEQNCVSRTMLQEAARTCGVGLLDPIPLLCPNGRCMGSLHHRSVIRDDNHLTEFGNHLLTPLFATIMPR